jgi:cyclopropane-fatty-acyl-phospholipid synthase
VASQQEIANTYDYMDRFFRMSFGDHADISGAFYDGDFSMTLEEAQRAKHDYIFSNLGVGEGSRILDVGCGWGPVLAGIRERGGTGVGLTLSPAQAAANRARGLDARLQDWKTADPEELGTFDGVTSLGAFEHFCSIEEYRRGEQESIYGDFFGLCRAVLPPEGGRLFLQTMIWGENAPTVDEISLDAEKGSNGYVVALVSKFYPGSWLPMSLEQIVETARPHFRLVSSNNGRKDYIETMDRWSDGIRSFSLAKVWETVKLLPRYVTDRDFRYQMESLFTNKGNNRECFVRKIMEHERIVFEAV